MARNVDLTGKLGLAPKPTITIGSETLTVDDSAQNVLQIMSLISDGGIDAGTAAKVADMLFDKPSRKALDAMKLNFDDFTTVISAAINLVAGTEEPKGEAETLATT